MCLFFNVTWFIQLLADAYTYHHWNVEKRASKRERKTHRLGSNRCNITALKAFKTRSLKKLNAIHLRLVRVVGSRLQHIHHIVHCAQLPRFAHSHCWISCFYWCCCNNRYPWLVRIKTAKNGNNCVFVPIQFYSASSSPSSSSLLEDFCCAFRRTKFIRADKNIRFFFLVSTDYGSSCCSFSLLRGKSAPELIKLF